jgi:alpha-N-arabinofuranosidase
VAAPTATVLVDPRRTTGVVDDRVYGQFLENMGRAIYGGVYEPRSPLADPDGFRSDVLKAASVR